MTYPVPKSLPTGGFGAQCYPAFGRVLIVDDHPLFAQGLAGLMQQEGLAISIDIAGSLKDAATHLATAQALDLLLLDYLLQGQNGLSLLPKLLSELPQLPVVVISSSEDETVVRAARAAGARGFLPKSAGRSALVGVCRAIRRGADYFPGRKQMASPAIELTPRQREVLHLLAQGFPNKRICQSLNLTEHTVKTHLKAIFAHLGVHNRTECVSQARQMGWL